MSTIIANEQVERCGDVNHFHVFTCVGLLYSRTLYYYNYIK